jgi:hypothetical protein
METKFKTEMNADSKYARNAIGNLGKAVSKKKNELMEIQRKIKTAERKRKEVMGPDLDEIEAIVRRKMAKSANKAAAINAKDMKRNDEMDDHASIIRKMDTANKEISEIEAKKDDRRFASLQQRRKWMTGFHDKTKLFVAAYRKENGIKEKLQGSIQAKEACIGSLDEKAINLKMRRAANKAILDKTKHVTRKTTEELEAVNDYEQMVSMDLDEKEERGMARANFWRQIKSGH